MFNKHHSSLCWTLSETQKTGLFVKWLKWLYFVFCRKMLPVQPDRLCDVIDYILLCLEREHGPWLYTKKTF